jgi:hypothetical protein
MVYILEEEEGYQAKQEINKNRFEVRRSSEIS